MFLLVAMVMLSLDPAASTPLVSQTSGKELVRSAERGARDWQEAVHELHFTCQQQQQQQQQ
jgi:hypothetical protein